ncbi:MAG: hypothetical protein VXW84_02000 [Verrucomicrobiota bacterium]|nr:hypothetical protein [Verrucomicrobiota bacterium]MEC8720758.1 hypothetical protein [Verrucomicrobiota bacterium]
MNAPDDTNPQPNEAAQPQPNPQLDVSPGKASSESLSKEEQLARFEESLKHEDWGHQPC